MTSVIRKITKNMKNSICAILVAVAAMPPNPKTAAMIEMNQEYQRPVENGNLQLTGRGTGAPWLINNRVIPPHRPKPRFASDCVIRDSFASAAWRSNASVSSSHNSANVSRAVATVTILPRIWS
jgi:hypothetical protein